MDRIENPSSIDKVREVFERAVTAVGFHVTEVRHLGISSIPGDFDGKLTGV